MLDIFKVIHQFIIATLGNSTSYLAFTLINTGEFVTLTLQFFSTFLFQYFLCSFVLEVGTRLAWLFILGFSPNRFYKEKSLVSIPYLTYEPLFFTSMSVDSLDKIFVVILPNQSEFYFVFASVSCSKYVFQFNTDCEIFFNFKCDIAT